MGCALVVGPGEDEKMEGGDGATRCGREAGQRWSGGGGGREEGEEEREKGGCYKPTHLKRNLDPEIQASRIRQRTYLSLLLKLLGLLQ